MTRRRFALLLLWGILLSLIILLQMVESLTQPLANILVAYTQDNSIIQYIASSVQIQSIKHRNGSGERINTTLLKAAEKDTVVVAGLGDVLLMSSLTAECRQFGGFRHLWENVEYLWQEYADHVVVNFEGTTGRVSKNGEMFYGPRGLDQLNRDVYTNGIKAGGFNYHPNLAQDLAASGIDVISTANNHAFDRGLYGLDETIQVIRRTGVTQIGTILEDQRRNTSMDKWYRVSTTKGIRIAWIGCTELLCATCRPKLSAPEERVRQQVLFCTKVPELIQYVVQEQKADAIVVAAHWGSQFKDVASKKVVELAKSILEAGATAIVGNHPHVMQGSRHYVTRDGRRTYVFYSLGSLTSGLGSNPVQIKRRTSAVVFLELGRHQSSGLYEVVDVKYTPICEIWVSERKRIIVPTTNVANSGCKREEKWAKKCLGKAAFVQAPPTERKS